LFFWQVVEIGVVVAAAAAVALVRDSVVVAAAGIAAEHTFVVAVLYIAVGVAGGLDRPVLLRLLDPCCMPSHLPMVLDKTIRLFDPELARFRRNFGCGRCCRA